jgi:membrane-associated HD superfamily phosphohydrolase
MISLTQIILGTQVRQGVDEVFNSINSMEFIDHSIIYFEIHRTMAWLVVFSNLFILYFYRKKVDVHIERVTIMLMMSILIISGLFMTYQNLLGLGQLLHLICAVGLFLAQFSVLLKHYRFSIVEMRPDHSIVETPSLE